MSKFTVKQLATVIKMTPEELQAKLEELGIYIQNTDQILSEEEENKIFKHHLKQSASLQRKTSTSTLHLNGRGKTVTITRKSKKTPLGPLLEEKVPDTEPSTSIQENSAEPTQGTSIVEAIVVTKEGPLHNELHGKKADLETEIKVPRKAKSLRKELKKENLALFEEEIDVSSPDTETQSLDNVTLAKKKLSKSQESIQQAFKKPVKPIKHAVSIPSSITIAALARKLSSKVDDIIRNLARLEAKPNLGPNSEIDQDTAMLLVEEMGHLAKPISYNPIEANFKASIQHQYGPALLKPPVVTIMGHVDHGKTTLLDYIRNTTVAAREAGGITQHIGAYHVKVPKGVITFLDTPGHAAFTSMRARGANITDIVILIVAADDGVMPQTKEAIEHAQAAQVAIVVAINKIDQARSNIERIQQDLSNCGLTPEEWGGETPFIQISAKTGAGVNELLDTILLQAEMLELKAPQQGPAEGVIIESRLDKGQGCVATMLVRQGTLQKGNILVAGSAFGRVRALRDEKGKLIQAAGPSMPVEILGLSTLPLAGDLAIVVNNERTAREITLNKTSADRGAKLQSELNTNPFDLIQELDNALSKGLNIVLKADVQGSAEAIQESLTKLSNKEITIKLLRVGVGSITESDVNLAIASKAVIFGFNVQPDAKAKQLALRENQTIHHHTTIYKLFDQVKQMMSGILGPQIKEVFMGRAMIREMFHSAKKVAIAGCYVTEGSIKITNFIRVLRNKQMIHQGELHSLRRFKDNVTEVREGTECGIGLKHYSDLHKGDIIESYESVKFDRIFD